MDDNRIKALLIEENVESARFIHEKLKDIPYYNIDIEQVDRLTKGLDVLKKGEFDVILLNLSLPDGQGYNTFVRAHEHARQIPIVVLSRNSDETLAIKTLKAGAQDYLIKETLNSEILMRSIRYAIGKKQSEIEAIKSKQYIENLIEAAQDAIISIDENGRINVWNESAEKTFGYSKSEIIGQPLTTIIPERYKRRHQEGLKRFVKTGEAKIIGKKIETLGKTKEGTEIPIELSLSVDKVRDKQYMFTAPIKDITERKKREEEIYKLTCAVEQSPVTVIITDTNGAIEYTNPKFTQLTGYASEEAIGQNPRILKTDKTPPEVFKELWKAIRSGKEWRGEFFNKKKNGELFWESASISPVKNSEGVITHFVAVKEDITERKRAEKKLKQTLLELKRSNAELEQFAYVASHDLQEPLRMVASYVQLLQRRYKDKLDNDANEFIAYAVDGTKRMKALINDLLTYSRVGNQGREFELIDCETVFDQVVNNLEMSMRERGAVVTHDSLQTVMADGSQIVQLFQNLIGNAIKYCDEDIPRVHVSAKENEKEIIFSVRDNGIGIDPGYFKRIFTIFQRLHGKEEYFGTGIGLAICKKVVERHGGKIWVESLPGEGATFYFTIPKKGVI